MKNRKTLALIFSAFLALGTVAVGCGDDDSSGGSDSSNSTSNNTSNTATSNTTTGTGTSNTTTGTGTSNTTTGTGTSNTTTGPSCGDGECNGEETSDTCAEDCPAAPECGDGECNGAETSADCPEDCGPPPPMCGDGECNGAESPATCEEDCGPPDAECETDDDCWGDSTCMDGECVLASAEEYPFEGTPASFIDTIALETDGSVGADIDGDGDVDNALGNLLNQLGALLGDVDVNEELQGAIDSGDLTLLMAYPDLDIASLNGSSDLTVHVFTGSPTDTDGQFTIDTVGFEEGTGNPQIQFNGAEVDGAGVFSAGPAQFAFSLSLAGINIDLLVDGAQITADASVDGDGVALTDGELAGAVPLTAVVDALNNFLASDNCACLELDGPLITGEGAAFACTGSPGGTCSGDDAICGTIASACGLAVPIVVGQADIDLSGDGVSDSISVFIRIGASGATVTGLTPSE